MLEVVELLLGGCLGDGVDEAARLELGEFVGRRGVVVVVVLDDGSGGVVVVVAVVVVVIVDDGRDVVVVGRAVGMRVGVRDDGRSNVVVMVVVMMMSTMDMFSLDRRWEVEMGRERQGGAIGMEVRALDLVDAAYATITIVIAMGITQQFRIHNRTVFIIMTAETRSVHLSILLGQTLNVRLPATVALGIYTM